jgi:hypothetical protein
LKGEHVLRRSLICVAVFAAAFVALGQELWDTAGTTIDGKNVARNMGGPGSTAGLFPIS